MQITQIRCELEIDVRSHYDCNVNQDYIDMVGSINLITYYFYFICRLLHTYLLISLTLVNQAMPYSPCVSVCALFIIFELMLMYYVTTSYVLYVGVSTCIPKELNPKNGT